MIKTISTLPSEKLYERGECGTRFEFRDNAILGPTVSIRIEGGGGGQAAYVVMPLEDLKEVMRRAEGAADSAPAQYETSPEGRTIPTDASGLILVEHGEGKMGVSLVIPDDVPEAAVAAAIDGDVSQVPPTVAWAFTAMEALLDTAEPEEGERPELGDADNEAKRLEAVTAAFDKIVADLGFAAPEMWEHTKEKIRTRLERMAYFLAPDEGDGA